MHEGSLEANLCRACKALWELGFPLDNGQPWPQLCSGRVTLGSVYVCVCWGGSGELGKEEEGDQAGARVLFFFFHNNPGRGEESRPGIHG